MEYYRKVIRNWFASKGWEPFPYQLEIWEKFLLGESGILNAPTGSGKTLALCVPALMAYLRDEKNPYHEKKGRGLRLLWITPLRALAKDTEQALHKITVELEIPWEILRRTGDTSQSVKQRINRKMPQVLITTPESLHVFLSQKNHAAKFSNLDTIVVDEWHELLGSKRGVLTELGLSRLKSICPKAQIWGISATIGNLKQAKDVLLGSPNNGSIIKAEITKKLEVQTILPKNTGSFSWAGHIGISLIKELKDIIFNSSSTLLFTNTRAQAEIWYQALLDTFPDLAGQMALHHGSLDPDVRQWVEDAIHAGSLKLVVSTSSLDLGVDFSPVESVIQIGSPKGVARFVQRAGRSGHKPGATSKIYFVPTHAMELLESAALQDAIANNYIEEREPYENPLDVLTQYITTIAAGEGFYPNELKQEIKKSYAYRNLSDDDWNWVLRFVTTGGNALQRYEDYQKVTIDEDGRYLITNKRISRRHKFSIGTIVADLALKVRFITGGYIGSVEESFIAKLKPGDTFLFAGRWLEYIRLKELTVYVRKSKKTKGLVSRWMGGRMQLSTHLSNMIRKKMEEAKRGEFYGAEMQAAKEMLLTQEKWSALPRHNQLLIEKFKTREGWHIYFYPVAGRMTHEGLASLLAWRISQIQPISFSMAMNDYGFELLSDQEPPLEQAIASGLFHTDKLQEDIVSSINASDLAKRHFREIARIAGLVFSGFPGQNISNKHLQSSSELLFDVLKEYDTDNRLISQSFHEAMNFQLDEKRIRNTLEHINSQEIIISHPQQMTPFAFPIMVDRLRARLSSEKLSDRVKRMKDNLEKKVSKN